MRRDSVASASIKGGSPRWPNGMNSPTQPGNWLQTSSSKPDAVVAQGPMAVPANAVDGCWPTAQHFRAHVRMAEGAPLHRYALRQAREKFCGEGFIGLCHTAFATLLFVQSLGAAGRNHDGEADEHNMKTPPIKKAAANAAAKVRRWIKELQINVSEHGSMS